MAVLFNKGKRSITFTKGTEEIKDTHGVLRSTVITDSIGPGEKKSDVPEEAAKKLKRFYPHEIIDLDSKEDMQAQIQKSAPAPAPRKSIADEVKHPSEIAKEEANASASNLDIIQKIDGMDRLTILSFIEENELVVDVAKIKGQDALKKAVLMAYEAKKAA